MLGLMLSLYQVLAISFGVCENLLFSGIAFGWASLVYILKQEGYFNHLCTTSNSTNDSVTDMPFQDSVIESRRRFLSCPEQDAELQLVFTVATFSYQFLKFPLGMLMDKLGTLFMRLLISCLIVTGLLLIAFSSRDSSYLLFPATSFIIVGGVELMILNMQISNLFGRRKATVMAFLSGCLDSSAFVFIIFKLVHENYGISLQMSFFAWAGLCLFLCFNTFLLPKTGHIPYPLPPGYRKKHLASEGVGGVDNMNFNEITLEEQGEIQAKVGDETSTPKDEATSRSTPSMNEATTDQITYLPTEEKSKSTIAEATSSQNTTEAVKSVRYPSLRSCLISLPSLFLFIWFSLLQLNMLFFLGTINPELERLTNNNQTIVSHYTTALALFQVSGIVVSPLCGLLLDRNRTKKKMAGSKRGPYQDLLDSRNVFAITSIMYVVFNVSLLVKFIEVHYVSFLLHAFTRGFMFTLVATGCSLFFPVKFFGSTEGLITSLAALVALLQRPVFTLQQTHLDKDPFWVYIGLIVGNVITLILPVYIHIYVKHGSKLEVQVLDDIENEKNIASK